MLPAFLISPRRILDDVSIDWGVREGDVRYHLVPGNCGSGVDDGRRPIGTVVVIS